MNLRNENDLLKINFERNSTFLIETVRFNRPTAGAPLLRPMWGAVNGVVVCCGWSDVSVLAVSVYVCVAGLEGS